jgi:hypothetical protein
MKRLLVIAALLAMLTACGENEHAGHTGIASTEPVKVVVRLDPAEPKAGQPVTIKAEVTQAGEPVNDADVVLFEIWAEGADESGHDEIEGKLDRDGVYAIERTFPEPGTYFIIAHVTARTFHTMPKIELKVQ